MKRTSTLFLIAMCLTFAFYSQLGTYIVEGTPTISVYVLLDYGNGTRTWKLSTPSGNTVYDALVDVATSLNISWYGDDIFVDAIDNVWNSFPNYWIWWYWNFTESSWVIGPVACNKFILEDRSFVAWLYEDCSTWPPNPPSASPPSTVGGYWLPAKAQTPSTSAELYLLSMALAVAMFVATRNKILGKR
ncbi:MAG: hypothetical protein QW667_05070 [Candidatus Bathyarchaeia archaeon]